MRLSAPVYQLKRRAKNISRVRGIPFIKALDQIAMNEGFANWSLLARHVNKRAPSSCILEKLDAGELTLLGARPGHGKTLLALDLVVDAVRAGRSGAFFSFEFTITELRERFQTLGCSSEVHGNQLLLDATDDICADHIMNRLDGAPPNTVVVIDFLQALDQKRSTPKLDNQVRALKSFAVTRSMLIAFITQIDRSYNSAVNPVNDGEIRIGPV